MKLFVTATLAVGLVTVPLRSETAQALSYPSNFQDFPECTTAEQEFCVEKVEFTPTGGATRSIMQPETASGPYMKAYLGGETNYAGMPNIDDSASSPGTPIQMPPSINLSFITADGVMNRLPDGTTSDGLPDGKYRAVVRIGDYDPSYLLITGRYEAYTWTKGSDGYYTIDVTGTPAPLASVVQINSGSGPDSQLFDTCERNNWVTDCEANIAFRRSLTVGVVAGLSTQQRDVVRGTWLSTNASSFSLGRVDLAKGTIEVDAKGPHYVPRDFGISGLTVENGRELNPAFFEMFVPFEALRDMMSRLSGRTLTVDQVKSFLAKPTEVLEGTIDEVSAGKVVEKQQTIAPVVGDAGVRIDFKLTHFSAPNPTLRVKDPLSVGSGTGVSDGGAKTSTTRRSVSVKGGGTLSTLASAKAKKTIPVATLVRPSAGMSIKSVASSTASICTVSKSKLVTLKKGTCRYAVTVVRAKKSTRVLVTLKVS